MLPARCSRLPCRNMELKTVTYQGTWSGGVPATPSCPWHTMLPAEVVPHSSPGWVSS